MLDKRKRIIPIAVILLALIGYMGYSFVRSTAIEGNDKYLFYGTAEAEQVDVSSEVSGRISQILVQEGQQLKEGDLVAVVDVPENQLKAEQSEISVKSAENELKRTEEGNREEEINIQKALVKQGEAAVTQAENVVRQIEAQVGQVEQGLKTAQEAYDINKKQYDDVKMLYESGAATERDVDNAKFAMSSALNSLESSKHSLKSAQAQLSGSKAQLESANAQLAANREKLALLINGATDRVINASEFSVEQAKKSLALAELTLDKSKVVAAKGGLIETVNFSEGEYIGLGSPVVSTVDLSDMWVRIYVPEKLLPELKQGKAVSIKCDALKGKEIRGQIVYISPKAEYTPINIVTKEDRMKLVFAVKVKIMDNLDSIRPGMLLDVNVK